MCIIEIFVKEDPPGKSPWKKDFFPSFIFSLDKIPKIKIWYMVQKEHHEVI